MAHILLILLALLSFVHPAEARRTSVDVASESVMPSNIKSMPIVPVGTVVAFQAGSVPDDIEDWLECLGQAVPAGAAYDKLRGIIGGTVPDLRQQFLRGGDASLVSARVDDLIKSHEVYVPGQSAPVTGWASPHGYTEPDITIGPAGGGAGFVPNTKSGSTSGGPVTGTAAVAPVTGIYTGAGNPALGGKDETAPEHTFTRYFIRAIQ